MRCQCLMPPASRCWPAQPQAAARCRCAPLSLPAAARRRMRPSISAGPHRAADLLSIITAMPGTRGVPLLLLALSLSWLAAAGALPGPGLSEQRSQHALSLEGAAEGDAVLGGAAASAAAGAGVQGRNLLKQPLPNFEIGVPAPPKKEFRCAAGMLSACRVASSRAAIMRTHRHPPPRADRPPCSLAPCLPGSKWQSIAVRERRQELSSSTFLAHNHPGKDYVSLCVVARDAHADMLEWLNHHIRWVPGAFCVWVLKLAGGPLLALAGGQLHALPAARCQRQAASARQRLQSAAAC